MKNQNSKPISAEPVNCRSWTACCHSCGRVFRPDEPIHKIKPAKGPTRSFCLECYKRLLAEWGGARVDKCQK